MGVDKVQVCEAFPFGGIERNESHFYFYFDI
jgi:hypothetical protein